MRTSKEALWQQYYSAVKSGRRKEAQQLLNKIHTSPRPQAPRGGCSRCKKRFA